MRYAQSLADAILDRSPEELIGALLLATAIGGVMMGVGAIRRRKGAAPPIFAGVLVVVASLASMALTAGYLDYDARSAKYRLGEPVPAGPDWAAPPEGWGVGGFGWSSGFHVVVAADRDRDGRVTPEEAARLVREADAQGEGSVSFQDIDRYLMNRGRSGSPRPGPGGAGPSLLPDDRPPNAADAGGGPRSARRTPD